MEVIRAMAAGISDLPTDNGDLIVTLLHAASLIRQRLNEFLERFELNEGRYLALDALSRAGVRGLSQSDVADYLVQSESNVSSLIDRLHRDSLVNRTWSVTDRRKRVLLLTEAGQQLIDRVNTARQRWEEGQLSKVSLTQRQQLRYGLKLISEHRSASAAPTLPKTGELPSRVDWPNHNALHRRDPSSPHFALEQMLSTLGLAGRFAEDEQ